MTQSQIICAGCKSGFVATALYCPNCGRPKQREAQADALIGKVLGERFTVLELLGQGASGTIYRAEHVTLRRKVAIKVLHDELSRDDLAVERFRREATTVAEIDNEHLIEIHDFGRTSDGRLYLAMELLEGETMDSVLARERTLSVEKTADILMQVGEALMEAHAIGYIHRDLRPRNIYLAKRRGKANFVKLLDFGLAKLVENDAQAASTSLGMTFGDPRYMSPEQARGDRIDRRADIYQLGCVAYEMLTGAPPFSGNRVFDILTKQVSEIPAPLPTRRPGVPLWMEAAVAKMLAKDPENRFATTTRMVEALRRGLESGEVMEDDVARRRESIPPPSVSRVMHKMGLDHPIDPPAPAPAPMAVPAPAPAPSIPANLKSTSIGGHAEGTPASLKQTVGGHASGILTPPKPDPVPEPFNPRATNLGTGPTTNPKPVTIPPPITPPAVQPLADEGRKRTGTPRIGVPVVSAPASAPGAAPAPAPVPVSGPPEMPAPLPIPSNGSSAEAKRQAAAAALAGKPVQVQTKAKVSPPPVHDEQVDPDLPPVAGIIDAPPERSDRARKPTTDPAAISQVWYEDEEPAKARKQSTLTSTGTGEHSFYEDDDRGGRKKSRLGLFAAIGTVLLVGLGVAIAMNLGGGDSKKPDAKPEPAPIAQPSVTVDAAPSTEIAEPDAAVVETPVDAAVVVAKKDPPTTDPKTTTVPKNTTTTVVVPPNHSDDPNQRRVNLGGGSGSGSAGSGSGSGSATGPTNPYGDDPPDSGKAEFFSNLGQTQLGNGDLTGAAASFKKAAELDPKNTVAVIGLGQIAMRQGLYGDAVGHLSKAVVLGAKTAAVFTMLGDAYLAMGNHAQAAENFKKALQIDPDNTRARDGFNEAQAKVPPPKEDP